MASGINQLKNEILKEMEKAINITASKALADMYQETGDFYTQGKPKKYIRTGALGDTPEVTPIKKSGTTIEFDAYLDTNSRYDTGINPSMQEVLSVANKHGDNPAKLKWPLGKQGFWDRSEQAIKKDFEDTMSQFFEKV